MRMISWLISRTASCSGLLTIVGVRVGVCVCGILRRSEVMGGWLSSGSVVLRDMPIPRIRHGV
jgi:hypothetical protein